MLPIAPLRTLNKRKGTKNAVSSIPYLYYISLDLLNQYLFAVDDVQAGRQTVQRGCFTANGNSADGENLQWSMVPCFLAH